MQCVGCKGEAAFQLQEWYCNSCFCSVIERRIRKSLRQENPIIKGEHLLVFGTFTHTILRTVIKELPVNSTVLETEEEFQKAKKSFPEARCVLPGTMEHGLCVFLDGVFHGRVEKAESPDIMLFSSLTMQELTKYVELQGIILPAPQQGELFSLLNKLEDKYPSTKYSLLKSVKTIHQVLENANVKKIAARDPLHEYPSEH